MPQCIYCLHNLVEKDGRVNEDDEFICRHCDPDAEEREEDSEEGFGYSQDDYSDSDEERHKTRPPRRRTE